jgi:hypothetical protein
VRPRRLLNGGSRPLKLIVRRQMSRSLPGSTVAIQRASALAIAAGIIAGGATMWLTTTTGLLSPGGRPGIVPLLVALSAFSTALMVALRGHSTSRRRVAAATFLALVGMLVLAAVLTRIVERIN